jgi:hypothetical protein
MIGFSLYMIKTVFNGRGEFSQPAQMSATVPLTCPICPSSFKSLVAFWVTTLPPYVGCL